jgi:Bacterial type II and III secretion system protein
MQRSISYQPVGTTVKMTPRIGADNAVALELNVSDSKVRAPDAGDEAGASSTENNSLTTRLNVPAGRSVVAQSVRTETKAGAVISLVVVTARVVDENPKTSGP